MSVCGRWRAAARYGGPWQGSLPGLAVLGTPHLDGGRAVLEPLGRRDNPPDQRTSPGLPGGRPGAQKRKKEGLPKKYAAVFLLPNGRQRTVRFGTASNYVSNPRKTVRDRAAYIARHRVNENHDDPLTPGALSRWLLWGESRSLARNTAAFRRRFRLQ